MKKLAYFVGGVLFSISATALAASFSDQGSFSGWFKSAAESLQEKGVIQGYPDGSFRAGNTVTRAELAVMLDRYHNYLMSEQLPELFTKHETQFSSLGGTFTLLKGQSAFIDNEGITVKAMGFMNSPCPPGVQCITEGLRVDFDVIHNGETISLGGKSGAVLSAFGYQITILDSDYTTSAKFKVEKAANP